MKREEVLRPVLTLNPISAPLGNLLKALGSVLLILETEYYCHLQGECRSSKQLPVHLHAMIRIHDITSINCDLKQYYYAALFSVSIAIFNYGSVNYR